MQVEDLCTERDFKKKLQHPLSYLEYKVHENKKTDKMEKGKIIIKIRMVFILSEDLIGRLSNCNKFTLNRKFMFSRTKLFGKFTFGINFYSKCKGTKQRDRHLPYINFLCSISFLTFIL